jgi:hypothetical protein
MQLRELIEKNKKVVLAILPVVVLASLLLGWHNLHRDDLTGSISRTFFSDDDGKTYFAEDASKGLSFDHDGKPAYRAFVYHSGSRGTYVGLLARPCGDDSPTQNTHRPVTHVPVPTGGAKTIPVAFDIKKPGDAKWVVNSSPDGQAMARAAEEDGAEQVLP